MQLSCSGAPQSQVPSVSEGRPRPGALPLALYRGTHPLQSSRQSSIVTPQILICRATQSLARIVRHDDLCLAAHLLLPSPPQSLLRVVYGHVQMSLPPVWYLLYVG